MQPTVSGLLNLISTLEAQFLKEHSKIDSAGRGLIKEKLTSFGQLLNSETDIDNLESSSRFEQMANSIQEVFWMTDTSKKKMIYISPGYEKIWGRSCKSLYEDPLSFAEAIHVQDRGRVISAFSKQVEGTYDERYRITRTDGSIRWIRDRAFPVVSSDGGLERVVGIAQDITDLVAKETEIQDRKMFLEIVLENIPSMIFVKDYGKNLSFSLLNKAGERILGLSSQQFLGKTDHDFFPKEQADFFLQKDREIFASRCFAKIEKEVIDTAVGKKFLSTYKVPTYDEDGNPHLLIGISNEITEELKIKEALDLERSKSIQNAKLASLGEMSAGVAHEINNPLAIIAGAVSLLEKSKEDPVKFAARIATIERSIERISRIVSGLRKFSRTTQDMLYHDAVFAHVLQEALVLAEVRAKRFSTHLESKIKTNAKICCDEVEIEQVIVNLVNNAIDAAKKTADNWVKVEAMEEADQVVLRVFDSGKGISFDVEQRLFQPFFTTKPAGEGTGLGLSIAKGILDQHKATIHFIKTYPNTCFEVRFQKVSKPV